MAYKLTDGAGLIARMRRYFPDYEIHVRSGGKLRFIRISSKLQMKVAAGVALAALAWLLFTLGMIGLQLWSAGERVALDQRAAQVAESANRVATYRESVETEVERIERRQDEIDAIISEHFGNVDYEVEAGADDAARNDRISAAVPQARALDRIEARQLAFARSLERAVEARARRAEDAIREFGLNPRAMGGPLEPVTRDPGADSIDEQIENLEVALNRLATMEMSLRAIPSSRPTTRLSLTSGFGLRSDPFGGGRAMHSGLDIGGRHGQGILATAGGRVVKAGYSGGYGNMIEIDHGAGMTTRYAHLSGIDVRVGQSVARGQRIGRMGSTGRSTATHLHYEIRINGRAINPRPFLEANPDVLEIQSLAVRRNVDPVRRG